MNTLIKQSVCTIFSQILTSAYMADVTNSSKTVGQIY